MAITIADIEQLTSEHRTLADGAPIDAEVSALIRNLFLHPLIDLRVRSKGDMDIILAILATAPKLSYPRYFSPDREKCRRTLINGYSLPGDLYAHPPSVLLGRYSLSQACICRLLPAAGFHANRGDNFQIKLLPAIEHGFSGCLAQCPIRM